MFLSGASPLPLSCSFGAWSVVVTNHASDSLSVTSGVHEAVDEFVTLPVHTVCAKSPVLPDEKTSVQTWVEQCIAFPIPSLRCGDSVEIVWDASTVTSPAVSCDVMRIVLDCDRYPQVPLPFSFQLE
jgi:hypothetical protein